MDTEVLIQDIEVKSFKEVHEELEMEHMLLQQNHNVADFKSKASFLNDVGLSNSIATRLYEAISSSTDAVKDISNRYHSQHKFLLEPQLERVCEKYNLYVRNTDDFIADIPEKNIKDIMNFKVYVSDLPEYFQKFFASGNATNFLKKEIVEKFTNHNYGFAGVESKKVTLAEIGETETLISRNSRNSRDFWMPIVQIAAVRGMFSPEAFARTEARIINSRPERSPRFKVNLDPIVLCNTKHKGRLIVTAWGDEANDELVVNQKLN